MGAPRAEARAGSGAGAVSSLAEREGRASDSGERGRASGWSRGAERPRNAPPQVPALRRYGERPRPAWHPLPLSELLILVGAIGVVIGLRRGLSHGGPPLFAGLAAVALGTFEVTLREHRGGFRSHTVMLAALPVIVFHSAIALLVSAFASMPAAATLALFGIDLLLFLAIFRLLRSSFLTARTRAAGRG